MERNISPNIVKAVDLAKARSAKVFGIVGRDSGYIAKLGIDRKRSFMVGRLRGLSGGGLALPGQPSVLAAQANEMVSANAAPDAASHS